MTKENEKLPNVPNLRFPCFTNNWVQISFGLIANYKKGPFGSSLTKSIFVPKSANTIKVYEQQNAINKDWTISRYYITNDYYQKMKSFTVRGGDIIVSCAGTIGESYIIPNEADTGIINQALMIIRTNEKVNQRFYIYLFNRVIKAFSKKYSNGSAIKNIPPFIDLKKFQVKIPSIAEQEKLAHFFTLIDEKLRIQNKIISKYETLIKGLSDKIFKHDKTTQLSDLVKCKSSTLQENRITTNNNGQYKVFGASGMISTINNYQFDNSAVLVLKDGSKAGKIQYASGKYSVVGTSVVLIPNDARDARYLYFAMLSVDFEKYKVGSGIPHIYFKDYSVEKIYYPDFKQREKIVKTLDAYEAKTNIEKEMLSALQKQKAFLLKSMFI